MLGHLGMAGASGWLMYLMHGPSCSCPAISHRNVKQINYPQERKVMAHEPVGLWLSLDIAPGF